MMVDLHTHTTCSDGSHTPRALIKEAEEAGVEVLSITDHDRILSEEILLGLQQETKMKLVSGVEISAYDTLRQRKVHLLAYGFKTEAPRIRALCAPTLKRRQQFSLRQIEILRRMSFSLHPDNVPASHTSPPVIYKQHIMSVLTDEPFGSEGYCSLYRELFKNNGPVCGDIPYPDIKDALAAVKEDGGLAVIAHPGLLDSFALAEELVPLGLDGIEVWHPEHDDGASLRAYKLAVEHGLLVSGGSDTHGHYGWPPQPGIDVDSTSCTCTTVWESMA